MIYVDFKKGPWLPVNSKGQAPIVNGTLGPTVLDFKSAETSLRRHNLETPQNYPGNVQLHSKSPSRTVVNFTALCDA